MVDGEQAREDEQDSAEFKDVTQEEETITYHDRDNRAPREQNPHDRSETTFQDTSRVRR
jgi:hypothetical protein